MHKHPLAFIHRGQTLPPSGEGMGRGACLNSGAAEVHLKATQGRGGQPLNLDSVQTISPSPPAPLLHMMPQLVKCQPLPILRQSRIATIGLVASWVSLGMVLCLACGPRIGGGGGGMK